MAMPRHSCAPNPSIPRITQRQSRSIRKMRRTMSPGTARNSRTQFRWIDCHHPKSHASKSPSRPSIPRAAMGVAQTGFTPAAPRHATRLLVVVFVIRTRCPRIAPQLHALGDLPRHLETGQKVADTLWSAVLERLGNRNLADLPQFRQTVQHGLILLLRLGAGPSAEWKGRTARHPGRQPRPVYSPGLDPITRPRRPANHPYPRAASLR